MLEWRNMSGIALWIDLMSLGSWCLEILLLSHLGFLFPVLLLVPLARIELAANGLGIRCSIH